jgi:hypothetical protein
VSADQTVAAHDRQVSTAVRFAASVLVVIGGVIHLKLYGDGYRHVPNANLGRSFLLNATGALALGVMLAVRASRSTILAALVLVNATLVAFGLSRTARGVFGFNETGLNPAPEAVTALTVEIAAAVLLIGLLVRLRPSRASHLATS